MFDSVLIANRGEIARRIIRTLRRLGIRPVVVHSPTDARAAHVRDADLAMAVSSYLDIEEIVAAGVHAGADALHPGYGFASENPELARACAAAGLTFVGPPPQASQLMGDKLRAKEAARAAGVPTIPTLTEAEARAAPYPLLVKAAAGGGGRGMRVVNAPGDLDGALASARREAQAGFGDDRVFIERFLPRARHLEVQVIADSHGSVLHLGERECSLQRRHQKVIEESPSPAVSAQLRERLGSEAVSVMSAAGYVNAGTVEFVADADDPAEHYFLEVNARLQVEHPVTELVCGVDLVELQLRIAAGEPLGFGQEEVALRGHAIEARICAEDATRDFMPASGRILVYDRPRSYDVRVDDAIDVGDVVDTAYDSLLAKIVVHDFTRAGAIHRLEQALGATTILGVTTTTGFLRAVLRDDAMRAGRLDTGLVGRLSGLARPMDDEGVALAAAMLQLADATDGEDDPFGRVDGWRLNGTRASSRWDLSVAGNRPVSVEVLPTHAEMVRALGGGRFTIDGRGEWALARDGVGVWIGHGGWAWPVAPADPTGSGEAGGDGDLRAPMPGQVLLVPVAVGDGVAAGDPVVVLESMKMELVIAAPFAASVTELCVEAGDRVTTDQPLARVEPAR